MTNYRYSIDLQDKYLFGVELEFVDCFIREVSKALREKDIPSRFALHHKSRGIPKYDMWYVDIDSTILNKLDGDYYGGEVISRILSDDECSWRELKEVCSTLKELNASIDGNCSNHVRVNLTNIKNERYFFEVLSKLITIFEMDIREFYMGDKHFVRPLSFEYARLLGFHLLSYINNVDFSDPDYYYKLRNNGICIFDRRDGINLRDYPNKKLVEFRYPNGTINEKTVQNNINFTLKLVDAIDREIFDPKELTNIIEKEHESIFNKYTFDITTPENFENLVNLISTSSEDVNDFISQYERILSTKRKI